MPSRLYLDIKNNGILFIGKLRRFFQVNLYPEKVEKKISKVKVFAINVQTAAVWYIGVRFSQNTIFARFITLPSDPMPVSDFQLMNEIF